MASTCPHCGTGYLVGERLTDFGANWRGPLQFEVNVLKCLMCARMFENGRPAYGSTRGTAADKDDRRTGARHDNVGV